MQSKNYRVLLFYKYVEVKEPEKFVERHLAFCRKLGVLGRILVSHEGINGTLSGTIEATNIYMEELKKYPEFHDMFFKIDEVEQHAFKRISVRVRKEIVNLSLEEDINPNELTGRYLSAQEWKEALNDPKTIVLDARNDYEYDIGHFRGAIKPDIKTFRELPFWVRKNKHLFEGKKIVTYCTGGVRCEKFSGWLIKEGFQDVGQLYGGIHTYAHHPSTQGSMWDGKLYVFDERIAVDINKVDKQIVGKDYFTGAPCERYINCGNPDCNVQILASEASEVKYLGSCSDACRLHPRNRWISSRGITMEEVKLRIEALRKERQQA